MDDEEINQWLKKEEEKDFFINYIKTLKKKVIKMEEEIEDLKKILKKNNIN
jgi:hypothetical protein